MSFENLPLMSLFRNVSLENMSKHPFCVFVITRDQVDQQLTTANREPLLEGTDHYGWPPCANQLRSVSFDIAIIIFLFYKTAYLNEEVNRTEPFPSVSVPCCNLPLSKNRSHSRHLDQCYKHFYDCKLRRGGNKLQWLPYSSLNAPNAQCTCLWFSISHLADGVILARNTHSVSREY